MGFYPGSLGQYPFFQGSLSIQVAFFFFFFFSGAGGLCSFFVSIVRGLGLLICPTPDKSVFVGGTPTL